jgi:CheY-like chemotaxis protein
MRTSPIEVLIIDDCAEDREIMRSLLLSAGDQHYRVREACNGEEGVQAVLQKGPQCILLDFRLPDADGLRFLEKYANGQAALKCLIDTRSKIDGAIDSLSPAA